MKKEIVDKLAALITAAFGLVAALAWNDAIKAVFTEFLGTPDSMVALLTYATVVTIIAVIATLQIGKLADKAKK